MGALGQARQGAMHLQAEDGLRSCDAGREGQRFHQGGPLVTAEQVDMPGIPKPLKKRRARQFEIAPYRRFAEELGRVKPVLAKTGSTWAIQYKGVNLYASIPSEDLGKVFLAEILKTVATHKAQAQAIVDSATNAVTGMISLISSTQGEA